MGLGNEKRQRQTEEKESLKSGRKGKKGKGKLVQKMCICVFIYGKRARNNLDRSAEGGELRR